MYKIIMIQNKFLSELSRRYNALLLGEGTHILRWVIIELCASVCIRRAVYLSRGMCARKTEITDKKKEKTKTYDDISSPPPATGALFLPVVLPRPVTASA